DQLLKGSVLEQVVNLERLVLRGEPLGARRRAALAARIERKLQRRDQAHDLVARGDMGQAGARAQRRLVEVVESTEPAQKQLAVDDALGEPVGAAKAQPGG